MARSPPSLLAAVCCCGVGGVGEGRPNPRIMLMPGRRFIGLSELPKFRLDSTKGGAWAAAPARALPPGVEDADPAAAAVVAAGDAPGVVALPPSSGPREARVLLLPLWALWARRVVCC